jgi:preprotein translocase subunit SecA
VLGGNVEKLAEGIEADASLDAAAKAAKIEELRSGWRAEHEKVVALGGLRIIATERHESRRIDNQLRGRSGRQGDPGSSRFYLSLDDPLMRIFAGDRVKSIMERLKMPEGEAIEAGIVSRSIESAQRKVEARNFDIRKQLLEYDDVSNDQRKVIYQQRNDILDAQDLAAQVASLRQGTFTDLVREYVPLESVEEQWDLPGLEKALRDEWQIGLDLQAMVQASDSITDEEVIEKVVAAADTVYEAKVALGGRENFTNFERIVLLQNIDSHWRDHLSALDYLRQGIHLRGYAQKQPKQEYKREAFELFGLLLDTVKNSVTKTLVTVHIQSSEQVDQAAHALEDQAEHISNVTYTAPDETGQAQSVVDESTLQDRATQQQPQAHVGRNDPCPCGSGKKFKFCHGKLS